MKRLEWNPQEPFCCCWQKEQDEVLQSTDFFPNTTKLFEVRDAEVDVDVDGRFRFWIFSEISSLAIPFGPGMVMVAREIELPN